MGRVEVGCNRKLRLATWSDAGTSAVFAAEGGVGGLPGAADVTVINIHRIGRLAAETKASG